METFRAADSVWAESWAACPDKSCAGEEDITQDLIPITNWQEGPFFLHTFCPHYSSSPCLSQHHSFTSTLPTFVQTYLLFFFCPFFCNLWSNVNQDLTAAHVDQDHSWWSVSAGWFLSVQVNKWLGSGAQLQLSCRTVTLCGVHVMCGRQWQTCGFCVSVWAGLYWAICHMFGLCVQPLSRCFLGVTCAFVLRGGEPCGLRDAYSYPDYMFCVSSCLSKPALDATLQAQGREKGTGRAQAFFA